VIFFIYHVIPVPELYALCRYMAAGSGRVIEKSESEGLIKEKPDEKKKPNTEANEDSDESPKAYRNSEERPKTDENNNGSSKIDESELRLAQLQHQLPANEPGALMHLVEASTADDADDEETKQCKSLFKNLKFYLSREVSYCPYCEAQSIF
jgi:pescadillo